MARPDTIPPIAIYGMGRFGRALAGALKAAGCRPARTGGRKTGPRALLAGLKPGTLVVLAVRDDAVAPVAAEFAALPGAGKLAFVHASGAFGTALLAKLEDTGANVGCFHVLQSLPPNHGHRRLAGAWCALAGPARLRGQLAALARRLGMRPFVLPDKARPAYHAAAVLASNALVAWLALARDLMGRAGFAPRQALRMLLPLVRGTLDNVAALGPETALTGPVVRGDTRTLTRHLAAMNRKQAAAWRAAVTQTTNFAEAAGRITKAQARAIRAVLFE
ncbi:MAG: DUF2520 domain-containing protein [Planctomycetes bacterium]|jgi:predicted short-subunit dehydrogenase-like oxidoreductase (DUF2520 family)|nr:DUF2520 domain-containing protein [Planctomycetota bacterium]MCL4731812.1 DUF2520 domain-containing protein [Planctomycetota bacterium]